MKWLLGVTVGVLALGLAACGSGGGNKPAASQTQAGGVAAVSVAQNPAQGAILVDGKGRTLYLFEQDNGTASACTGACASIWPAFTGTAPSGEKISKTSTFRTLTPTQTFSTHIFEGYKETYGVGIPIMLTFSRPITNKAAVERSLELTTSKPVIGAWYWDGDQQLDFRPRDYWPAYTTVSFAGHLDGVEGAKGVYGTHNLTQTFEIGRSLIAVASTTTTKQAVIATRATRNRTGMPDLTAQIVRTVESHAYTELAAGGTISTTTVASSSSNHSVSWPGEGGDGKGQGGSFSTPAFWRNPSKWLHDGGSGRCRPDRSWNTGWITIP